MSALNETNTLLLQIRGLAVDAANSGANDSNTLAANQAQISNALEHHHPHRHLDTVRQQSVARRQPCRHGHNEQYHGDGDGRRNHHIGNLQRGRHHGCHGGHSHRRDGRQRASER